MTKPGMKALVVGLVVVSIFGLAAKAFAGDPRKALAKLMAPGGACEETYLGIMSTIGNNGSTFLDLTSPASRKAAGEHIDCLVKHGIRPEDVPGGLWGVAGRPVPQ